MEFDIDIKVHHLCVYRGRSEIEEDRHGSCGGCLLATGVGMVGVIGVFIQLFFTFTNVIERTPTSTPAIGRRDLGHATHWRSGNEGHCL